MKHRHIAAFTGLLGTVSLFYLVSTKQYLVGAMPWESYAMLIGFSAFVGACFAASYFVAMTPDETTETGSIEEIVR